MSDTNKHNENKLTTSIKKIKEPDFSKEVVIDRLVADKQALDFHFNRMKTEFGDKMSDQEIHRRIHNMVVRDNIFNAAMHIIVPCYEIKIDEKDINNITNALTKGNPRLANAPHSYVQNIGRRMLEKEILFAVLAKEWKITVDDTELRSSLDDYYRQTNHPIREILQNPERMESIRKTILDQKIANAICSKLKYRMDNEAIIKNAEANRKAIDEAMSKAQAHTKVEDKTKK